MVLERVDDIRFRKKILSLSFSHGHRVKQDVRAKKRVRSVRETISTMERIISSSYPHH